MRENPALFIVEDDEGIRELYEGALSDYDITLFENGNDFFNVFKKEKPDLIILDIMLPDMDGYSILSQIRLSDEKVPVIIVSAKSDELSSVKGLNKGADDYITKPFSILELNARIKANLRRSKIHTTSAGGFSVDNDKYEITYMGKPITLTLKEFNLFKMLIQNSGITLTREELFSAVWGTDFAGETRTLDIHIASLREKIKKISNKDCIITVRGIGYRFENK